MLNHNINQAVFQGNLEDFKNSFDKNIDLAKLNLQGANLLESSLITSIQGQLDGKTKGNKTKIFFLILDEIKALYKINQTQALTILSHQDYSGNNIAHFLCNYGFYEILHKMLSQEEDWIKEAFNNPDKGLLFTANKFKRYPIHAAILNNHAEIVNLLMKQKNIAFLQDYKEQLPIHYAALYGNETMIENCCGDDIDLGKLNKKEYLNLKDTDANTPIMLAKENDNYVAYLYLQDLLQK